MGNASNAPLRSRLRLGLPSRPLLCRAPPSDLLGATKKPVTGYVFPFSCRSAKDSSLVDGGFLSQENANRVAWHGFSVARVFCATAAQARDGDFPSRWTVGVPNDVSGGSKMET